MTGWKCPGCGACYAPFVHKCQSCGPKATTTTTGAPFSPPPFYAPAGQHPWTRPENQC